MGTTPDRSSCSSVLSADRVRGEVPAGLRRLGPTSEPRQPAAIAGRAAGDWGVSLLADVPTWGALSVVLATAFVLGAMPVFVVRCIARMYPKGHPRRNELVAEMAHVRGLGQTVTMWTWLGEMFATAACDAVPLRLKAALRRTIPADSLRHMMVVGIRAINLTNAGDFDRAELVATTLADPYKQVSVLASMARLMSRKDDGGDQVQRFVDRAEQIITDLKDPEMQALSRYELTRAAGLTASEARRRTRGRRR